MDFTTNVFADRCKDEARDRFRRDVLTGLSQEPKVIPARWFYDHRGSELFEDITRLPEYYPTRTETLILRKNCAAIGSAVGKGRVIVEFGAGSAAKTPIVIDCVGPTAYVPIDISGEFLRESCNDLALRYPEMPIVPVEGDFTRALRLPEGLEHKSLLGFFPGSTIGNLEPAAAVDLLRSMRETLGDGSLLLIGMDCIKDRNELLAAYDDAQGVTARFNLNLLRRINRELDGTFPVEELRHEVRWDDGKARIEMHLQACRDIGFSIGGRHFSMREGETIHTENSHKYDHRSAAMLLLSGGWAPERTLSDPDGKFMVILARALGQGITP